MRNIVPFFRILLVLPVIFCLNYRGLAQNMALVEALPHNKQQKEKTLKLLLDELEAKYKVHFTYANEVVDNRSVRYERAEEENLEKELDRILTPLGLMYTKVKEHFFYIFQKQNNQIEKIEKKKATLGHGTAYQAYQIQKLKQKDISLLESSTLDKNISGKVTDENDEGLPGVNILVKGSTTGTVTDVNGNYRLSVPDDATGRDPVTLVFSSVGYETQEVIIGSRSVINLALMPDLKRLDEIVVVGYGTVKKSDLTGSVSSVDGADLAAYPAIDAVQALQGRAAGVSVQSTNGEPGSDYKIQIRGSTSINANSDPLIVVDGFVGGVMPPAEDIESIEILKDASAAAIYGSRGANGVVMVTTKRGKSGTTKVNFSSSWSLQKEINRLELLNADQFAAYIQEIEPSYNPELTGEGTDWQDEIYQSGSIQNHQLSISGGTDKVSYYLSGTVFDHNGVIVDSEFKRYSVTSNIEIDASEIFSFGANLFARKTKQNGTKTQETGYYTPGVVSSAYKFMPTQGIRDANGNFSVSDRGDPIDNPYALATEWENESIQDLFQGNLYGEINILKDLKFRSSFGANLSGARTGTFFPRTLERGGAAEGEAWLGFSKNADYLTEHYFTYTKNIAQIHDFTLIGGYSYQSFRTENINTQTTGYLSDSFSWWNIGASTDPPIMNSGLVTSDLSSWYGRINYSYKDKFLLTFSARQDGSSRFAKNNKWAFFPSAAAAWNVSNEEFLSNNGLISTLKLRLSYGEVGNQAIQPYQSLASFTSVFATVQGNQIPALRPSAVSNPDLTWETTTQADIGIDVGLFGDRVEAAMDYYHKETSDLLFNVPLPNYSGFTTQLQNVGVVENKGFEFAVNSKNLVNALKWDMNFNIAFNKNRVTKLIENDKEGNDILYSSLPLPGSGNTQLLREGEPTGMFWGYVYDGVLQSQDDQLINGEGVGGESFKDLNGDGMLTDEDRTIIGNPHPDFTWGWSNNFSFNGFDLNIFFQGSQGGEILNYTLMELGVLNGRFNATSDALRRWTSTNTDTDIPMASAARGHVTSDRWVEDASYIRLKNISLGYTLPEVRLSKIKITSARIYVSGQNLLTVTDYKGLDPEVAYKSSNSNLGLDYGSYPNAKSYTVGLNIAF